MTPQEEFEQICSAFEEVLKGNGDIHLWLARAWPFFDPHNQMTMRHAVERIAADGNKSIAYPDRVASIRSSLALARVVHKFGIPSPPPQEDRGSDSGPKAKMQKRDENQVSLFEKNKWVALAVILSALMFGFGYIANNSGNQFAANICYTLGCVLLLADAAFIFHKDGIKYGMSWLIMAVIVIGIICWCLATPPKPHNDSQITRVTGDGDARVTGDPSTMLREDGTPMIRESGTVTPAKPSGPVASKEPGEIIAAIHAARPIQQSPLRDTFTGAPVRWLLGLYKIMDQGSTQAAFAAFTSSAGGAVRVKLSDSDRDLLRLLNAGDLIWVSGTIESIDGDTIVLKDSKLVSAQQ